MSEAHIIENMPPLIQGRAMADIPTSKDERDEPLLFNALLYPNRSLPNAGFIAVMTVVIAFNVITGIVYLVIGAWPVVFFAGLDIFAVWLAFRLSYRQGRLHERVLMTADELWVCRVLPSGHESRWKLQPYWTRIEIERPANHESQLKLISHGKTLVLGAFLSPAERGELADALQEALAKSRLHDTTKPDA